MDVRPDDLKRATPEQLRELDMLLQGLPLWRPLPGPQTAAFESLADITGYGGAAGGGKTDLAVGLSVTQHRRVGIFRQNGTELTAVIDRFTEVLGNRDGYNGKDRIWNFKRPDGVEVQLEFGSFPDVGDEQKFRGRPHDFLVFDEAAEMRKQAVLFLLGWLRTTVQGQRTRALLCFNPPTTVEGRWIIEFFAPWLDPKHPKPALPGELRWFAMVDGVEREVESGAPFEHKGETIRPESRTFIPSRITDNPYLLNTGYMRRLQSMPEPLRSQLLYGDFQAGVEDDPYQVIPTRWIEAAMARWKPLDVLPPMDSVGVDVAQGGKDNTVIAARHGMWFAPLIVHPGRVCTDGATTAGFILAAVRNRAPVHIDLFGVGAQPFGHLMAVGQQAIGVMMGDPTGGVTEQGSLAFANRRSELWWRVREALDPMANTGIALPPDRQLLSDLAAPKWSLPGRAIKVQSREEIIETIGRSPDRGTAVMLALMDTLKRAAAIRQLTKNPKNELGGHDPYRGL